MPDWNVWFPGGHASWWISKQCNLRWGLTIPEIQQYALWTGLWYMQLYTLRSVTRTINHAYIMEAQEEFWNWGLSELSWMSLLWVYCVTLMTRKQSCPDWIRRGETEAPCLILSLPYKLLPLVDFNLNHFPVINHNCKFNSFQWVVWEVLVNYQTQGLFWEHPEFAVGVRCDTRYRLPSPNFTVGYSMHKSLPLFVIVRTDILEKIFICHITYFSFDMNSRYLVVSINRNGIFCNKNKTCSGLQDRKTWMSCCNLRDTL